MTTLPGSTTFFRFNIFRKKLVTALIASTLTVGLAGCATNDPSTVPAADTSSTGENQQQENDAESHNETFGLTISDVWVKAAEEGMSSAFGQLENTTDTEIVVVSAVSEASTSIELHETVMNEDGQMVMRENTEGFVIPGHSTYVLEPGADHFMLMELTKPLIAGDTVQFTLTLDSGETIDFEAPIKDYSGANEQYEHDGHDSHDHH